MNNKKNMLLGIIAIVTLLVLIVGATYAYFTAQTGSGASADVNVTTSTTDNLTFNTEGEITINATQQNFGMNAGNISDSAKASATLRANNATNSAYQIYDVYLYVTQNEFEYTSDDYTPELILTVTRPDGTEIKNVDGLEYVTVGDVSGLDITEYYGLITIANSHVITTTGTLTEDWNLTLTFVNLDSDQEANTGKTLTAELLIGQTSTVDEVCEAGDNLAQCLMTLSDEKGYAFTNILKHDETLELGAKDNSYRYTGGDYEIVDAYKDTYAQIDNDMILYYTNGDDAMVDTHYASCGTEQYYYFAEDGQNYNFVTYGEVIEAAVGNEYISRNINNYVCFGSDLKYCPSENRYRIIGVFDNQVKLIKADYINESEINASYYMISSENYQCEYGDYYLGMQDPIYHYQWNTSQNGNDWSTSDLKEKLNSGYLNKIGTAWSNKIAYENWYVGGVESSYIIDSPVTVVYDYEQGENRFEGDAVVNAQVGLMYPSEYGYATDQSYWNRKMQHYKYDKYDNAAQAYVGTNNLIISHNWMYLGIPEWTIIRNPNTSSTFEAYCTLHGGISETVTYEGRGVRPTFSLLTTITYQGGSGTIYDPIRIA